MDQTRTCSKCGPQDISLFRVRSEKSNGVRRTVYRCILCDRKRKHLYYISHAKRFASQHKSWCASNRDRAREIIRKAHHKCRLEAILAYSPTASCSICGTTYLNFLAIDHIDGGGTEHRRTQKIKNISYWLKKNGFPPGFRVLCHNCNFKYGRREQPKKSIYSDEYCEKLRLDRVAFKISVLQAYGNCCACCGTDDTDVLSIDHVDGGGTKHRRKIGFGNAIYKWLRKNKFPSGYRVLCLNCNISIGVHGQCPHRL